MPSLDLKTKRRMPTPRDHVLLLTSCIDPGKAGEVRVERNDPQTRLLDYKKALEAYLSMPCPQVKHIIFADNSGSDLSDLQVLHEQKNPFARTMEFFSFDGNDVPDGMHYGYAELGTIDHILLNSQKAQQSKHFVKATGRLFFPNLPKLISHASFDYKAIVDCRTHPFRKPRDRRPFVTSTLCLFETRFYQDHLVGKRSLMLTKPGMGLAELLYFHILEDFKRDPQVHRRFPFNVDPVGVGAHWNEDYQSSKFRRKAVIRGIMRKIAPQIWI